MPIRDDSLVAQYIRAIENSDSTGYKNGRWYQPDLPGYDVNNRGFGVDIVHNVNASTLTKNRRGKWLTEEEERKIRNEHIEDNIRALETEAPSYILRNPPSEEKQAMAVGMLYRGDTVMQNPAVREAYLSGTDNDMQKAVSDYYKSKKLSERAQRHNQFFNPNHSNIKKSNVPISIRKPMPYTPPSYKTEQFVPGKKYEDGGYLSNDWDSLSIQDKAEMMKVAIANGITSLPEIKKAYNKYADGGTMKNNNNMNYYDYLEQLAEKKAKEWGLNPDTVYYQMLNDNTYNYKALFDNDRESAMKMLSNDSNAHFPDIGKTVYHPTFSNESIYSGVQSDYNPKGTIGGTWLDNTYIPSSSQYLNGDFNYNNTRSYLDADAEGRNTIIDTRNGQPAIKALGFNSNHNNFINNNVNQPLYNNTTASVDNNTNLTAVTSPAIEHRTPQRNMPKRNNTSNAEGTIDPNIVKMWDILLSKPNIDESAIKLKVNDLDVGSIPYDNSVQSNTPHNIFSPIIESSSVPTTNNIKSLDGDPYNLKMWDTLLSNPYIDESKIRLKLGPLDEGSIPLKNNVSNFIGDADVKSNGFVNSTPTPQVMDSIDANLRKEVQSLISSPSSYINDSDIKLKSPEDEDILIPLTPYIDRSANNGIEPIFTNYLDKAQNKYRDGGYMPSKLLQKDIARWEGSEMQRNKPFSEMTAQFNAVLPKEIQNKLQSKQLDALYSYGYNVGMGKLKDRVLPILTAYTQGKASNEDVQKAMWASKDSELRGLTKRRNWEREMFGGNYRSEYTGNKSKNKNIIGFNIPDPAIQGTFFENMNTNLNNIAALKDVDMVSDVDPEIRYTPIDIDSIKASIAQMPTVSSAIYNPKEDSMEGLRNFNTAMTMMGQGSPFSNLLQDNNSSGIMPYINTIYQ